MKPPRHLQLAVDTLANEVPHGHLLASTDGAGLLLAAAEMLKTWRPIVLAALEMQRRWDARESPARQQDAQVDVVDACRELGKEHRP